MKDQYCLGDWDGNLFSNDDLFWGLDFDIGPTFEVRSGNVLYISGWCFHKIYQIKKFKIILGQISYAISHKNVVRPDIFKMFSNRGLVYKNSLQCGFWCIIPIKELSEQVDTQIILEITLRNDETKNIILGKVTLSPSNLATKELSGGRCAAYGKVSEIKKYHSKWHVMICMATYNPNKELFEKQIYSIRNQTYKNWSCIINDDCSEIESYEWICEFIGDDNRFLILRNTQNIGFYKNFEKLLNFVPKNVDFVALSDQDDYWFCEKLERLINEFDTDTTLVYSDMRIVDESGKVMYNTFWTTRKNYFDELDYLVLVNTITGAASMFRSSILKYILPFPISIGVSYHDHWIGCVANALGKIKYIDAPLYDYYQHGNNILGQATFPKKNLYDRLKCIKNISNIHKIKDSMIFYQCVFNIDGVRSIILASNLILRIPIMNIVKKKNIKKFYSLTDSSLGLFIMIIRTIINKKTTCDAERYLFKAYWADKIIRLKMLKII